MASGFLVWEALVCPVRSPTMDMISFHTARFRSAFSALASRSPGPPWASPGAGALTVE